MIIVAIVFVVSIIIFISSNFHNKMKILEIKSNTIEEKISSILLKRKELLKDSEILIKEIINTKKNIYEGFEELNSEFNIIELDRKLLVYINEFNLIKDKYEKLESNEDFQKLAFSVDETEDLLASYKKYYNDTTEKYNKLVERFPVSIVSFIKGRKKKEFFDDKEI